MLTAKSLFLIHLASTLFMTGLIWFVQIVHYPLLSHIGKEAFTQYEVRHIQLTGWVVIPPMLIELATASLLLLNTPHSVPRWANALGFGLLLLIWLSTMLLQAPQHTKLANGYDPQAYSFLVSSNWIRTLLWTARSLLLMFFTLRLR